MGLRRKIKNFFYKKKFSRKEYLNSINKKNILVTGANSGIGLALTKKLLKKDNKIIATYRENKSNLLKIKDNNLYISKFDQSEIINNQNLESEIKLNNINMIFNCAGMFGGSFNDQEIDNLIFDKFIETLTVNSVSILKILQIIFKNNKSELDLQLLVNISSDAGSIGLNKEGDAYIYRTSKAALNAITKNLSIDLKRRFNTVVFAIDPGNVNTNMNKSGIISSDNCADLIIDLISKKRELLNGKFVNLVGDEIIW